MSAKNGDKSRFHRLRKAKCARRLQLRELRAAMVAKAAPAGSQAAAPTT
ncbi:MAG TPA: hypothetical protein VMZ52_17100 [Bryobacteraceae bacterium]|nr:hypothetical protein [Bryobacteraceae bacterium]